MSHFKRDMECRVHLHDYIPIRHSSLALVYSRELMIPIDQKIMESWDVFLLVEAGPPNVVIPRVFLVIRDPSK